MMFIVGLGNPGKKYTHTRHNVGFRIVDELVKGNNFPEFKLSKNFNSLFSESFLGDEKIILAKPQSFMNNSGKSIKSLISFYKTARTVLVVIHDDIDLPLGKIRIVKNRGAAGHKGVESIIKEIGTKNFVRFRIGIQPMNKKPKNAEKFVLQNFNKEGEKIIKEIIEKTVGAIKTILKKGLEETMNEYN